MRTPLEKHTARMAHRAEMVEARNRLKGANADYAMANGWKAASDTPGSGNGGANRAKT